MKSHPLAALFPLMEGERFEELCEDVRNRGLLEPIVTHEGAILDGRNRDRACDKTGVAARYVEFGTLKLKCTPEQFVWSKNLQRRDLTPDQRAMIVTRWKRAELREQGKQAQRDGAKRGGRGHKKPSGEIAKGFPGPTSTRAKVAKLAGVSEYMVRQAQKVAEARPDLLAKVKAGEMTLLEAQKEIRADAEPKPKPAGAFKIKSKTAEILRYIQREIRRAPEEVRAAFCADLESAISGIWEVWK